MDEFDYNPQPEVIPQKRTFWQKLGGGSLTISIIFHGVLILIGGMWIYTVTLPVEKNVDFEPNSGGGGSPASESKSKQHRVQMMQPNMSRVAAVGATSTLTLPEPDEMSQMTSLGSMSMGGMAGGLGGSGSGGGRGDGQGLGVGSGLAPGIGTGTGTKNPFGAMTADRNALVGTFYDLKQTTSGKETGMTDDQMRQALKDISRRGFRESVFSDYFRAPRKLYQTRFYIPVMPADSAPAAFEVQNEVQPRRWIVVYRGAVQAPKSGKFRFVGEADDLLVVRFNNRPVFDFGYTQAGTGIHVNGRKNDFNGTNDVPELEREVRRNTPMRIPITMYKYAATTTHNNNIGGLAVGPEFQVEAGKSYPVEIMIGEIPGGSFSLTLLIEEIGANYQKDPAGFPILPLFRLDDSLPEANQPNAAPFDPNGPIWRFSATGKKLDI